MRTISVNRGRGGTRSEARGMDYQKGNRHLRTPICVIWPTFSLIVILASLCCTLSLYLVAPAPHSKEHNIIEQKEKEKEKEKINQ